MAHIWKRFANIYVELAVYREAEYDKSKGGVERRGENFWSGYVKFPPEGTDGRASLSRSVECFKVLGAEAYSVVVGVAKAAAKRAPLHFFPIQDVSFVGPKALDAEFFAPVPKM